MEAVIKTKNRPNKKTIIAIVGVALVIGTVVGLVTWQALSVRVFIDKAEISSSLISLSPSAPGTLAELMVREGDQVTDNQVVARVGDELIKTQTAGLVLKVSENLGKTINPGEAVVTMINPENLRVVAHLDENKGLPEVAVGQRAVFTVDAFGSKEFVGVVDEISDTSRDSDLVFSISDKREAKKFDVKVRFSLAQYPELKNGMSAQVWIYKK